MRRWFVWAAAAALVLAFVAPAQAIYVEEKPDYWGAIATGPVWFENFGWGVYVQGGYYFTRWIGVGLGTDWSIDAQQHIVKNETRFDTLHGFTHRTWEFLQRRQFFPAADLRLRFPMADDFQLAFDLGLGAVIDNSYRERRTETERNSIKTRTVEDISPKNAETAFMIRPSLVFKFYNISVGYRFFWLANGTTPGHMAFVGLDWDI
jgi:hypothetical protein